MDLATFINCSFDNIPEPDPVFENKPRGRVGYIFYNWFVLLSHIPFAIVFVNYKALPVLQCNFFLQFYIAFPWLFIRSERDRRSRSDI